MGLRIATLNVWGLPWGLARDLPQRLEAIGARLPGLDADVVAFQEVWTSEGLDALRDAGRRSGHAHAWSGGGGLLVLSRRPLGAARFEAFRARGLPERVWNGDYQAGKGFAELELERPSGRIALFVTHLVSQYAPDSDDVYRSHRMAQVVQLAARVRARPEPVVALGDFNLREDQPHHAALTGLTGLRDAAAERARREPTVVSGNPYRRDSRPLANARIDYVFVRDGLERGLRVRELRRVFDEPLLLGGSELAYSDHAGLRAVLEVDAAQAVPRPLEPAAVATARRLLLAGRDEAHARRLERRRLAAAGLGAGAVALLGSRRPALTRRQLLRGLLVSGGALAGLAGAGCAGLAEIASPDESRAFEATLRQLEHLEAAA